MKALSGRSFRNRLERVIGLVVALVMICAAGSGALAAELPGGAGQDQSLSPSNVTQCEAQLAQAAPDRQQAPPPYAGLASLHSDTGGFDLWRPAGWSVRIVDGTAIILNPDGGSQGASFSIQVMDTLNAVAIDDPQGRIDWFNNLITALPNTQVERQSRWYSGNITGFEARYTYSDDESDTAIAGWMRLLYVGTQQYWLVAEAPSAAEFDSLEPMFLAMMLTFRPDDEVQQYVADMCIA
jgi:hypothetical protein